MRSSHALIMLSLATLLAGCTGVRSIVPNQSTLAGVYASLGRPTDIRFDERGDELWEYARGPMGTETYLIRTAGDGRVMAVTQLLTEAQFEKILPGKMTKADVRNLLGRPSNQAFLHNGTSWTWRVFCCPLRLERHRGRQDHSLRSHEWRRSRQPRRSRWRQQVARSSAP